MKGGRENAGLDLVDWAKKCERLGAGEIFPQPPLATTGILTAVQTSFSISKS
ncbi:hypothetical protein [Salmonella enterica]|uniref:hypothetical protein n=1 Tax=Salmonella enterica TaxID=28901 RepID=UPI0028160B91|nr:hypothetical protein [Salmonella enterica]